MQNQQSSYLPALAGNQGAKDTTPLKSRRNDILNSRRREKLKNDLVMGFGQQHEGRIYEVVNQHTDLEYANGSKPYNDVYEAMQSRVLQAQLLPQK